VSEESFAAVWRGLTRFATWSWAGLSEGAQTGADHLPESLRVFESLGTGTSIALAIVLVVFLAAVFILGRRSR
jgi:hypothetical protein